MNRRQFGATIRLLVSLEHRNDPLAELFEALQPDGCREIFVNRGQDLFFQAQNLEVVSDFLARLVGIFEVVRQNLGGGANVADLGPLEGFTDLRRHIVRTDDDLCALFVEGLFVTIFKRSFKVDFSEHAVHRGGVFSGLPGGLFFGDLGKLFLDLGITDFDRRLGKIQLEGLRQIVLRPNFELGRETKVAGLLKLEAGDVRIGQRLQVALGLENLAPQNTGEMFLKLLLDLVRIARLDRGSRRFAGPETRHRALRLMVRTMVLRSRSTASVSSWAAISMVCFAPRVRV